MSELLGTVSRAPDGPELCTGSCDHVSHLELSCFNVVLPQCQGFVGQRTRKSGKVFSQVQTTVKTIRADLYARVSTQNQLTLPMNAAPCAIMPRGNGWTIAIQVKEVGSGALQKQQREKLLEAARRREIDVVMVWRLDRWGRSVTDLLAILQEQKHFGVSVVSLIEALDVITSCGSRNGRVAGRLRQLRAGDTRGLRARRSRSCAAERKAARPLFTSPSNA